MSAKAVGWPFSLSGLSIHLLFHCFWSGARWWQLPQMTYFHSYRRSPCWYIPPPLKMQHKKDEWRLFQFTLAFSDLVASCILINIGSRYGLSSVLCQARMTQTQTQTNFIQHKWIQVPYQVYMHLIKIQITLYSWYIMKHRHVRRPPLRSDLTAVMEATRRGSACTAMLVLKTTSC